MWHAMLPTVLVQVQCRLNSPLIVGTLGGRAVN